MIKQDIIDEVARRLGDEDPNFKSSQLAKAFDFVLIELAQENCLALVRRTSSTLFSAGTIANGLVSFDLPTLFTLSPGRLPERVNKCLVPSFGYAGSLAKMSDADFEANWLTASLTQASKPRIWRTYPTIQTLQLWPAPDTDSLAATLVIEWESSPATLNATDTITEVMWDDLPTLIAGLHYYGALWRDEAIGDRTPAFAEWEKGKMRMRERRTRQDYGRPIQIRYNE